MSLVRKQFSIGESSVLECWIFVIRYNDDRPDEFWFKGNDVAEFLEYKNSRKALIDHVDCQWKQDWSTLQTNRYTPVTSSSDNVITPSNWQPHTVFISEAGLYALVLRSKKAEAIQFQKWIMEDVLPSLRRSGSYTMSNKVESMDIGSNENAVLTLQKDLTIQKLQYELQLSVKERELSAKDMELSSKDMEHRLMIEERERLLQERDFQAREARWLAEKERLELHYRYAFQTDSAKVMGKAAIEQYIQRKSMEETSRLLKTTITDKYRLMRNMQDVDPMKVNNLGFVYNEVRDKYQVIRQQWGTTLHTYDYIKRSVDSTVEVLDKAKCSRRQNTSNAYIVGELIPVAQGTNTWAHFVRQPSPFLFGLMFYTMLKFKIMKEDELRKHYQFFATQYLEPQYINSSYTFYRRLFEQLNFADEDDCIARCTVPDIWFVRAELLKYIQTHSYDAIEVASASQHAPLALTSLTNDDTLTDQDYAIVAQHFPEDAETLKLKKICENFQLIPPSSSPTGALQRLAIE